MVLTGFNRRFAPGVAAMREAAAQRTSPLLVSYRMNAGHIPGTHWVHGPEGGGRNIGEACHIYDLFVSLTDADVVDISARAIAPSSEHWKAQDNFVADVTFADGSLCSLIYTSMGSKDYPKERMDIFASGSVLSLDDYKSVTAKGVAVSWSSPAADKGHMAMLKAFGEGLKTGQWPISLEDQLKATRISLRVEQSINPAADWVDRPIV